MEPDALEREAAEKVNREVKALADGIEEDLQEADPTFQEANEVISDAVYASPCLTDHWERLVAFIHYYFQWNGDTEVMSDPKLFVYEQLHQDVLQTLVERDNGVDVYDPV